MFKRVLSLVGVIIFSCLPVWAVDLTTDINPALNRVQTEITARNVLNEKETTQVMARVRTQLENMVKAGVEQGKIDQVANQACYLVRAMTQNKGEFKEISNAVALMAGETINGGNPEAIGQMLQKNLNESKSMSKAIKQTRSQIQQQTKTKASGGGMGSAGSGGHGKGGGGRGGNKR